MFSNNSNYKIIEMKKIFNITHIYFALIVFISILSSCIKSRPGETDFGKLTPIVQSRKVESPTSVLLY